MTVSTAADRVLGWDMLRGLCALAVASYHLLYWQELASLYTLGSYGVYLFFVLSGASLAYNYTGRLAGQRQVLAFLVTRWLRLAPLYIVLCLVFIAFLAARNGALADRLPTRLLLNASFAFGLYDPVIWALLIGGWSLGIEFVYYLLLPWLLRVLPHARQCAALALALVALQWLWIVQTLGPGQSYADAATAYHQVPAFAAYFFGGCIIGYLRRSRDLALPLAAGLAAWATTAVILLALNPIQQGDELLGLRGLVLFAICFAVVFISGHVSVRGRIEALARWLGDITYGTYLLHPMLFFGFVWFVLPGLADQEPAQLPMPARWSILAGVLVMSCATATASERQLESPLRRWGRKRFGAGAGVG